MSYCRNQQTIQEYQGRLCGRSLASHACAIGREQRDSLTHLNEWTFPINLHFAFYQSRNTGDSFIASKMWKPSLTVQEFDNVKGWREISVLNRVQACFNKLRDRAGSRQPSMRAHAQRAYTKKGDLTGFLRKFLQMCGMGHHAHAQSCPHSCFVTCSLKPWNNYSYDWWHMLHKSHLAQRSLYNFFNYFTCILERIGTKNEGRNSESTSSVCRRSCGC